MDDLLNTTAGFPLVAAPTNVEDQSVARAKALSKVPVTPVAWRIADWCKALSISRAQFYVLLGRGGIEIVRLGGTMPLIRTSPTAYLAWAAEEERRAQAAAAADPAAPKRGRGGLRRKVVAEQAAAE